MSDESLNTNRKRPKQVENIILATLVRLNVNDK